MPQNRGQVGTIRPAARYQSGKFPRSPFLDREMKRPMSFDLFRPPPRKGSSLKRNTHEVHYLEESTSCHWIEMQRIDIKGGLVTKTTKHFAFADAVLGKVMNASLTLAQNTGKFLGLATLMISVVLVGVGT